MGCNVKGVEKAVDFVSVSFPFKPSPDNFTLLIKFSLHCCSNFTSSVFFNLHFQFHLLVHVLSVTLEALCCSYVKLTDMDNMDELKFCSLTCSLTSISASSKLFFYNSFHCVFQMFVRNFHLTLLSSL